MHPFVTNTLLPTPATFIFTSREDPRVFVRNRFACRAAKGERERFKRESGVPSESRRAERASLVRYFQCGHRAAARRSRGATLILAVAPQRQSLYEPFFLGLLGCATNNRRARAYFETGARLRALSVSLFIAIFILSLSLSLLFIPSYHGYSPPAHTPRKQTRKKGGASELEKLRMEAK